MEDNELRDLVLSNKNLIYSIIHRFKGQEMDDLFQAGCIGLINAYNNYDSNYSSKFTTYAYSYILGEVLKYIRENRIIKVSPDLIKSKIKLEKALELLTQRLHHVPTDKELSLFLEIDEKRINEIRNIYQIESLDYNYSNGDLYDFIQIENLNKEELLDLKDALQTLDHTEQQLIIKRYFYNISQTDLAKELGINQVKISREEHKILTKLKAKMY